MDYAVISINNNQYLVKPGSKVRALGELGKAGEEITAKTLLVKDKTVEVGSPEVDFPITLRIIALEKTEKVDIRIFKAKSRYRKHRGHRQMQTVLEVVSTASKAESKAKEAKAPAKEAKKEEKAAKTTKKAAK